MFLILKIIKFRFIQKEDESFFLPFDVNTQIIQSFKNKILAILNENDVPLVETRQKENKTCATTDKPSNAKACSSTLINAPHKIQSNVNIFSNKIINERIMIIK